MGLGTKTDRERRAAYYYACDDEDRCRYPNAQIGVQKYKENGRLSCEMNHDLYSNGSVSSLASQHS